MRAKIALTIVTSALVGVTLGSGLRGTRLEPQLARLDSVAHAEDIASQSRRPAGLSPDLLSFADVAEQLTPSVVTVRSEKRVSGDDSSQRQLVLPFGGGGGEDPFRFFGQPRGDQRMRGSGSGFVVGSDGIILTNNHVVEGADKITVRMQDGKEYPGKVVGTDPKSDVAVVRVEAKGLTAVKLGDDSKLRVGEWVLAIGSPFGEQLEHSVTAGIISAKGRAAVGLADYEDFLQTDAAINPGNSGGPLVNLRGEVIGMNTAIASRSGGYQGVGFAIPITMAKDIMDELMAHGKVTRSWLGVSIQDVTSDLASSLKIDEHSGVVVADVVGESPAGRAGIEEGDVILSLDGKPAGSVAQFRNRVSRLTPGDRVAVDVLREGDRKKFDIKLEEKPEDRVVSRSERSNDDNGDQGFGFELANITPSLLRQLNVNVNAKDRPDGVVITSVESGSPAEEAGLRAGDIVRGVNRKHVHSVQEFKAEVSRTKSKEPVALLVRREDRSFYVTLSRDS